MSAMSEQGAAIATTKDGKTRWRNRWSMERTTLDGQPVLRFTERGDGIRSPFSQPVSWTIVSIWANDGALRPLRSETRYTDSSGRDLRREIRSFDWTRNQLRFEQTDAAGNRKEEVREVPASAMLADGIAGVLRGLDFNQAKPFRAHLMASDLKAYEVSFEVRGRERIQTPQGSIEAYKVEVVPHLGVLDLVRFLYPKTYFWFRVEPPHTWIRYEGLEDGPGSVEIILSEAA
jgi:hypothetical protein